MHFTTPHLPFFAHNNVHTCSRVQYNHKGLFTPDASCHIALCGVACHVPLYLPQHATVG